MQTDLLRTETRCLVGISDFFRDLLAWAVRLVVGCDHAAAATCLQCPVPLGRPRGLAVRRRSRPSCCENLSTCGSPLQVVCDLASSTGLCECGLLRVLDRLLDESCPIAVRKFFGTFCQLVFLLFILREGECDVLCVRS